MGAKVDTVKQISFGLPVFVQATGSSEPALAGAVVATKQGDFHAVPVKGNSGAFVFQVIGVNKTAENGEDKEHTHQIEDQLKQTAMQAASRFMQELYQKAKIKDNRYLFF